MVAIAAYLHPVQSEAEATIRGYRFNAAKIASEWNAAQIAASRGQFDYEWKHLFPGPITKWEITQPSQSFHRTGNNAAGQ